MVVNIILCFIVFPFSLSFHEASYAWTSDRFVNLILCFIVLLFSLSFHEASHAWTSERFGDPTGRRLGRITLNPVAHIDLIGTIIFPIVGFLAQSAILFGWAKPVPVNPSMWRDRKKANIAVSAAGPVSNAFLAIIAFIILKTLLMSGAVLPSPSAIGDFLLVAPPELAAHGLVILLTAKILSIALLLNTALALFNLIPVPPLDGSHVLESLLPYEQALAYKQLRPWGVILLFALILVGVFDFIYGPVLRIMLLLLYL
ncbi:MAG TPA: site-2 protease family protein [Blastocatellia bacterium]|nr:site-2 protease family protein [Blastocatellia bacterium]